MSGTTPPDAPAWGSPEEPAPPPAAPTESAATPAWGTPSAETGRRGYPSRRTGRPTVTTAGRSGSLWVGLVVAGLAAGGLAVWANVDDGTPSSTFPATASSTDPPAATADPSSPEPSPAESPEESSSAPPAPTVKLVTVADGDCIDAYPQYVTAYVHVVDCDAYDSALQVVGRVRLATLRTDREVLPDDGTLTAVQAAYAKQCAAAFPQLAEELADEGVTPVAPLPVEWATVPHELICLHTGF